MPTINLNFLERAIQIATNGLYTTRPNPRVGCVIADKDVFIAEGWHEYAGEPHAERIALEMAGPKAQGATAYVSLEPCCHHGKTPPCTEALIQAGIKQVVVAMCDPNPLVAGKGLDRLQQAGIEVVTIASYEAAALALNPGFVKRMTRGLPWVYCKMAMSIDGRCGPASGKPLHITSETARLDVQWLRARVDAIITGIGTIIADNPALTVRLDPNVIPGIRDQRQLMQPWRIVLDSKLQISPRARIFKEPGQVSVFYNTADPQQLAAVCKENIHSCQFPSLNGHVDLQSVLKFLAKQEVNEVLIEAGPTLAGAAIESGLVDELVIYIAPHLMGDDAMGAFHLPTLDGGHKRTQLHIKAIDQVGPDLRIKASLLAH